jgi:hypothetical protein
MLLTQLQATVAVSGAIDSASNLAGSLPTGLPNGLSNPAKDPFGFVLQVGTLLFGAEFLETKLNGLLRKLTGTVNEPGSLETLLKEQLYRMCVSGLGEQSIPSAFASTGYTFPVRLLDLFELFRLEPASDEGRVAQSAFEQALVTNVLRRPGTAYHLPDIPYLTFRSDASAQSVTITYEPTLGPQPAPTRLVDLFADVIFESSFRLLDPARIALDILDVVLGTTARARAPKALEREQWLGQVVDNLSAETTSETLFDFSAPALAQLRTRVVERTQGVALDQGCDGPQGVQIPAQSLVVPVVGGTVEPDLYLAYQTLTTTHLTLSSTPGAKAEAPVRDALTTGLAKALVLILARNTVLAPRVWSLLVLSKAIQGGYSASELNRYLSKGINEVDFSALLTGVRPLLEAAVQAIVSAGVAYMGDQLLKKLEAVLRPLLLNIASEQQAAAEAVLSGLTSGLSKSTSLL